MLADALERIILAAEQVGIRAIDVDAVDGEAAGFDCALDPRGLMITVADLKASMQRPDL